MRFWCENEQVKNVFGQFNAVSAIEDRARFNADAYEQSIENRMLAEVEVHKIRQNAEREKVQAQITVTQANARADAIRAKGAALRDTPSLINLTAAEKWDGRLPTSMVPGSALPFIGIK